MKKKINIKLRMFMRFKNYLPADASDGTVMISLEEGSTLEDLKNILGIPADEFGGIVVDGMNCEIEDSKILEDGDTVSFFSAVAGG
jgi:molybdopterin converting factor small subunit